jgi:PIN domain nuclease of toxin-antitoxin system
VKPRFLLDTHVIVRWLFEPRKLSKEQTRVLREADRRGQPMALSAISLIEIAALAGEGSRRLDARVNEIFEYLESNSNFQILSVTIAIAQDTVGLSVLRDPADRAIVATARVHGLRLVTSDQRIISSKLVPVIE